MGKESEWYEGKLPSPENWCLGGASILCKALRISNLVMGAEGHSSADHR